MDFTFEDKPCTSPLIGALKYLRKEPNGSIEDLLAVLNSQEYFESSTKDKEWLAKEAEFHFQAANSFLYHQNQRSEYLYILLEGEVQRIQRKSTQIDLISQQAQQQQQQSSILSNLNTRSSLTNTNYRSHQSNYTCNTVNNEFMNMSTECNNNNENSDSNNSSSSNSNENNNGSLDGSFLAENGLFELIKAFCGANYKHLYFSHSDENISLFQGGEILKPGSILGEVSCVDSFEKSRRHESIFVLESSRFCAIKLTSVQEFLAEKSARRRFLLKSFRELGIPTDCFKQLADSSMFDEKFQFIEYPNHTCIYRSEEHKNLSVSASASSAISSIANSSQRAMYLLYSGQVDFQTPIDRERKSQKQKLLQQQQNNDSSLTDLSMDSYGHRRTENWNDDLEKLIKHKTQMKKIALKKDTLSLQKTVLTISKGDIFGNESATTEHSILPQKSSFSRYTFSAVSASSDCKVFKFDIRSILRNEPEVLNKLLSRASDRFHRLVSLAESLGSPPPSPIQEKPQSSQPQVQSSAYSMKSLCVSRRSLDNNCFSLLPPEKQELNSQQKSNTSLENTSRNLTSSRKHLAQRKLKYHGLNDVFESIQKAESVAQIPSFSNRTLVAKFDRSPAAFKSAQPSASPLPKPSIQLNQMHSPILQSMMELSSTSKAAATTSTVKKQQNRLHEHSNSNEIAQKLRSFDQILSFNNLPSSSSYAKDENISTNNNNSSKADKFQSSGATFSYFPIHSSIPSTVKSIVPVSPSRVILDALPKSSKDHMHPFLHRINNNANNSNHETIRIIDSASKNNSKEAANLLNSPQQFTKRNSCLMIFNSNNNQQNLMNNLNSDEHHPSGAIWRISKSRGVSNHSIENQPCVIRINDFQE